METLDWAGIITAVVAMLTTIGLGFKWLITFIVKQANAVSELKDEQLKAAEDRIEILEIKLDARSRERD